VNAYIVIFSDGRTFLRKFCPVITDFDTVLRYTVLPFLAKNTRGSFYVIETVNYKVVAACDGTTVEYRAAVLPGRRHQSLEEFRGYWQ